MTGVDVLLIGMAGVPAQEARSAAISRKLFRVRTMRRFVMVPQLAKESKSSRSTPVGPDFEFQRQESLTPGFAVPIHYTRERIKRDTAAAVSRGGLLSYCGAAIAFTASAIS